MSGGKMQTMSLTKSLLTHQIFTPEERLQKSPA